MKIAFELNFTQKLIHSLTLNGWLFFDFQNLDPISVNLLKIKNSSRRWFYFVPSQGVAVKFVHAAENEILDHLPGKKVVYRGGDELKIELGKVMAGRKKIAAQYSPFGELPYISRLDAGTFELLKSLDIGLVSSAHLVQMINSKWSEGQWNMHIAAAKELHEIVHKTFRWMKKKMSDHHEVTELTTQAYILKELSRRGLQTEFNPVVAAGRNSGIPFYMPDAEHNAAILPGQIIQFYVAAKEKNEQAVYATQAWVGYTGHTVPEEMAKVFKILVTARDEAILFIQKNLKLKKNITGFEVDEVIQRIIKSESYHNYYVHRSGYSLGMTLDVEGVTIDSLEVKDSRKIIPQTCFSLEPALYFAQYGLRTSANVYIAKNGPQTYGNPLQTEILKIL